MLKLLDVSGCVVTIDAMGCQVVSDTTVKEIATQIFGQEGDYVLALEGNQGTLHEAVQLYFNAL